jgi:predicted nucleic acid-binding protein
MTDKPTLDTNVLIYAFGKQDDDRKQIAKTIISKCAVISLQVVNETVYVLLKKFKFTPNELDNVVGFLKFNFVISDLNIRTLDYTLKISDRYGFSFWDSMMVASAIINHCSILYSEDMQDKQIIEGKLQIINPFKKFNKEIVRNLNPYLLW